MSEEKQWQTRDGKSLYVFEMTDEHIANARAMCARELVREEVHSCDFDDEICVQCEWRRERDKHRQAWIDRFDKEIRRRKADETRPCTRCVGK